MIKWEDEGEDSLVLLTMAELNMLPDGIELECINGKKYVKGRDVIDGDTRAGHIAYGLRRGETLMFVLNMRNEQNGQV